MNRVVSVLCVCVASCGVDVEVCDDSVDNDENDFVDCADVACAFDSACDSCGDGVLDDVEGCDDGNDVDGDGCDALCFIDGCGDGIVDGEEVCDDPQNEFCTHRCRYAKCGDSLVQPGELCDDGLSNGTADSACDSDCRTRGACGDGNLNTGEVCDDGNGRSGDGCDSACHVERCGDASRAPNEECDDGNDASGDGCFDCLRERCGNARVEPGEECDDGEPDDGDPNDTCAFCENVLCGNVRVDPGEDCDRSRDETCVGCFHPEMLFGDRRFRVVARADLWNTEPFPLVALDNDRFVGVAGTMRIDGESIVLERAFPRSGPVTRLSLRRDHLVECTASGVRVDDDPALLLGPCDALAVLDSDGDGERELWRVRDGAVTRFDVDDDDAGLGFIEHPTHDVGVANRASALTVTHGDVDQLWIIDDDRAVWRVDDHGAVPTDVVADVVFAADLDLDGTEELGRIVDNETFIDATDVGLNVGLSAVTVDYGDLDGDGIDDVVFLSLAVSVRFSSEGFLNATTAGAAPRPVVGVIGGRLLVGGHQSYLRALD